MQDDVKALVAAAEEGIPEAIEALEKAPKMRWPFYWTAFNDLGTERQLGMSMGPIPVSKIEWYGRKLGLDGRELAVFEHVIRRVDIHYLNRQSEKSAARVKAAK